MVVMMIMFVKMVDQFQKELWAIMVETKETLFIKTIFRKIT